MKHDAVVVHKVDLPSKPKLDVIELMERNSTNRYGAEVLLTYRGICSQQGAEEHQNIIKGGWGYPLLIQRAKPPH